VLVGNKSDIAPKDPPERIGALQDLPHFAVSAKTGAGVAEMFEEVVGMIGEHLRNIRIVEQIDEEEEKNGTTQAHSSKPVLELNPKGAKLQREE
jgi:hypothetical protein